MLDRYPDARYSVQSGESCPPAFIINQVSKMEYFVKCPHCNKEIDIWDIAIHLEECKENEEGQDS